MNKLTDWFLYNMKRFSFLGLLLGGLFFAMSLTPSLIPRSFLFQGILAGLCFALGYGSGVFIHWIWRFLELPEPKAKLQTFLKKLTVAIVIFAMIYCLWRNADWQNSIRELMGMELLATGHQIQVAIIAFFIALLLILFGQLFFSMSRFVYQKLTRIIPKRIAVVIGPIFVGLFLINTINGVITKSVLQTMNASFQQLDRFFDNGIEPPDISVLSGSKNSLIKWNDLGRKGREFIVTGPSQKDISQFSGETAKQPIRVFVGLNSASGYEERAKLALEELIRVNAFDRKVLIVATPTGTGWMDQMGTDPLEYMHNGDTAIVGVQYSYLASYLSLLFEPERAQKSAKALFHAVYNHWTHLPKNARPNLYLHGLSLGSHGSEASSELYMTLGDPIQGALWSGPPFANLIWRSVTDNRNAGTPAWLPTFQDSSLIRFTSQKNALDIPNAKWGPLRIVYLQYASDPIVFFDMKAAFREPDWMVGERGPDVSPELTWYPIVTFVQLLLDMASAVSPPLGYGHNYAPDDYIDAWVHVTAPAGWSNSDTTQLKLIFKGTKKPE